MPDTLLTQVVANRAAFHEQALAESRKLVQGQRPAVLFIGCCDSRIIPEAILGAGPGQVFVSRVIANIVPPPGTVDSFLRHPADLW